MKTNNQVQEVIKTLENRLSAIKPTSLNANHRKMCINAQIRVLTENMTTPRIQKDYQFSRPVLNAALDARDWLDGKLSEFIYPEKFIV